MTKIVIGLERLRVLIEKIKYRIAHDKLLLILTAERYHLFLQDKSPDHLG